MKGSRVKRLFNLLFLMFFLSPAVCAAAPAKVYMVLWDGCEDACRGFQDYLKSARADVEIVRRDLNRKTDKIPALIAEVAETSPDLLVTWGTLATLEMLGTKNNGPVAKYGAVPAVFMVVSQPVESGLVSSAAAQGRNITGVTHLAAMSDQLQYAKRVTGFKRLGVVYNPAETNAQVAVDQLKRYAALMRFDLVERPVPADADGKPDAAAIDGLVAEMADAKVDLIYLGPDAFMNANRKALIDAAAAFSIPVFSASEGAVRHDGALFALVHRYYNVGRLAGRKALKILRDHVQAYDIPIETPQRPLAVVNMTAARKTGVYPPLDLLQNADLVNIPENE